MTSRRKNPDNTLELEDECMAQIRTIGEEHMKTWKKLQGILTLRQINHSCKELVDRMLARPQLTEIPGAICSWRKTPELKMFEILEQTIFKYLGELKAMHAASATLEAYDQRWKRADADFWGHRKLRPEDRDQGEVRRLRTVADAAQNSFYDFRDRIVGTVYTTLPSFELVYCLFLRVGALNTRIGASSQCHDKLEALDTRFGGTVSQHGAMKTNFPMPWQAWFRDPEHFTPLYSYERGFRNKLRMERKQSAIDLTSSRERLSRHGSDSHSSFDAGSDFEGSSTSSRTGSPSNS